MIALNKVLRRDWVVGRPIAYRIADKADVSSFWVGQNLCRFLDNVGFR